MIIQPSYQNGFARCAEESMYPQLWKELVGAWVPALGMSGNKLFDISGNGNHGDLVGGVSWVKDKNGWVLNFDGFDGRVNIDAFSPLGSGSFTVINYCYYDSNASAPYPSIIGQGSVGDGEWMLRCHPFPKYSAYGDSGTLNITGNLDGTLDAWFQLALRRKSQFAAIYDNGREDAADSSIVSDFDANVPLLLGSANLDSSRWFKGKILSTLVYKRATSFEEMKQLRFDPLAPFRLRQNISHLIAPLDVPQPPQGFARYARNYTQIPGMRVH